ncbi:hypothetical protein [Streptomyces similanensis]|uniref:hypothetical protein n=1 Tax=Streptomyces similanensis TaxID=1274988 RepID=UPI0015916E0A|nr:hypothetical protein HUT11_26485 [Streptomyces seoulensis]
MTEITGRGAERTCDLRQRIPPGRTAEEVGAGAQYRSHIAELGGFARARCPSDAC